MLIMRRDRVFQKVLQETGRQVPLERIHSTYLDADPWWLSTFGSKNLGPEEMEEAFRELDAMVFKLMFPESDRREAIKVSGLARDMWPNLEKEVPPRLYDDAEPVLKKLKSEGFVLGLVSNAPPDTIEVVQTLGLHRYLDHIVISGAVGCSKPNPEIFRIALRRTGGGVEETIHVGDLYEADIVGARGAGIRGVLIDRDGHRPDTDCPRIRSLHDLPSLIK